jgi:hypothetical protein
MPTKKRYDQETNATKNAIPAIPMPSKDSTGSLLDAICDFEEDEDNAATGAVSESEQFFAVRHTFGRGDRQWPLLWWMVSREFSLFHVIKFSSIMQEFGFHFPVVSRMA